MVWEKFSLRQKKVRGEVSDVFVYDRLPKALRAQICHILARCLGHDPQDSYETSNPAYETLRQNIAEELGGFGIGNPREGNQSAIFNFFANDATDEEALDIIDLAFSSAIRFHKAQQWLVMFDVKESMEAAVETLNRRFLEHQVGYTFIGGVTPQLIRRDNEHLHKETVLPALLLLHEEGFEGANDEYRNAHEHYRKGKYKECLNDCLKAFESTLKTICKRKKWKFDAAKDTASQLIDICVNNGLFPSFMTAHFGAIKGILSSGVPTVRNKMGGHGQGEQTVNVPSYYAQFLLNETDASIVFLVNAYKG